jgi:hypothetical protein
VPVLQGAVAYRQGFTEREQWANRRPKSVPVACPSGCSVKYDLIASVRASESDMFQWIEQIVTQMEIECPNHSGCIHF